MSINDRIERFAAPWIRELKPYHVEQASGLTKLDAMENPYSMPEVLKESWLRVVENVELNRYPDAGAQQLRQRLREAHALDDTQEVILGNGSDELIHMLCLAFAHHQDACLLSPDPSFAVYKISAQALDMRYCAVPLLAQDFSLDLPAMLGAIEAEQPAIVFIASPNNPTSNRLVDADSLGQLCNAAPGVVVLDEAYYRFAGDSLVGEIVAHENLLVMQTLSKIGLAGLRVGALFAARPWIDLLERVRMPYNINGLSQAGAIFALEHEAEFQLQIDQLCRDRETFGRALAEIAGITVWPSETNFILVRTTEGRGTAIFEGLKQAGILVKNLSGGHPALTDCLRITVGTPQQNAALTEALNELSRER